MDILNSIIEYIKFLENEYSLYISIHCLEPPLNSLMPGLGKYNTHYHPYCLCIKNHPALWGKCHSMQNKVSKKNSTEIFYGECCFGVYEYVVPIRHNQQSIGFISVSGYKENELKLETKIKDISSKYNIDCNELIVASEQLSNNAPKKDFIIAILSHLADELSMYASSIPTKAVGNNKTNYIYANALAYIHEHYTEPISVDDIASFCKCSRSYITKLFKNNGDFNIKSYIANLRIENAKKLLTNTDKSIKEIAFSLGFNDSNYFSNVFYKATGVYPRKYRLLDGKVAQKKMSQ